jgi:hypothetical protein
MYGGGERCLQDLVKSEENTQLGRSSHRWEDNIKAVL